MTLARAAARPRWLLIAALILAAVKPATAFDHAALAQRTLEQHILPGYTRFSDAAKAFNHQAATLCRAPSPDALAQARKAARNALIAWGRIEHIRFGPITENQRLDRLVFYPDPRGFARKQIARLLRLRDDADIEPEKLSQASVAVQGFTAVDRVLWGQGSNALAVSASHPSFRCRYLAALADGIAQTASDTLAAWSGPFRKTWLTAAPGNPLFIAPQETTLALVRAYVTEFEIVRLQRLAPLMANDEKSGHTELLLSKSGLGVPFLLADVEGIRDLVTQSGFSDPQIAGNAPAASAIEILGTVVTDLGFALRAGQGAIEASPDDFANPQARAKLAPMAYSLKSAEETGRAALGTLTGVALGFNSLDGD